VTIPKEAERPCLADVLDALKAREVPYWVDETAIQKMLSAPLFDQPVPVASARDGRVVITVEDGEKTASMVLERPYGGREITMDDVRAALRQKGVSFGIDEEAIEKALSQKTYGSRVTVARFQEPTHGTDAVVEYLFKTHLTIHPKEMEGQKIDYRELESVVSVQKGTPLARKTPATKGQNGSTVTGKSLLAKPGKDARLAAGKGAKLFEDGLELRAEIDGQPILNDRSVSVEPVFDVRGDIDYCTGNIHFAGSVRVSGNVISGFSLKATEHIHIDGMVEDAFVQAGGDVVIRGGIQGRKKGTVKAGGEVNALFIEQASVEAGGNIIASEALHSTLVAGQEIIVTSGKGHICGGSLAARSLIRANIIGSESGVFTELAVGFEPKEKAKLEQLKKEKAERTAALEEAEKGVATLHQYQLEGARWWDKHKEAYERLTSCTEGLRNRLEELNEDIVALEEALGQAEAPQVQADRVIHANVRVRIKDLLYLNQNEESHALFCEEKGEIVAKVSVT
jgi:hypothetical protein